MAALASLVSAADPNKYTFRLPNDVMSEHLIPMIGDPTNVSLVCKKWRQLQDGSYKFLLDAYRGQEALSRFVVNVPREGLSTAQCKQHVQQIYQAVMQDKGYHKTYRKNSAHPLALAPLVNCCATIQRDYSNRLEDLRVQIQNDRPTMKFWEVADALARFDINCPRDKWQQISAKILPPNGGGAVFDLPAYLSARAQFTLVGDIPRTKRQRKLEAPIMSFLHLNLNEETQIHAQVAQAAKKANGNASANLPDKLTGVVVIDPNYFA